MVKFSIIIPCYKVEKYIQECLDSVLAQDSRDWEAICVEDGSPDGTGVILDQYASKDQRIKVIHQKNRGLSEARNSALKIACGEWLYYLDSDDIMPPHVLRNVEEILKDNPDADLVRGALSKFVDGEDVKWGASNKGCQRTDLSNTLLELCCYFQQFFYKRSVFGDILFAGPHWSEEKLYFAKVATRANMLVTIDSPTYGFRNREGSITHSNMTLEQCLGFIDAMRDMLILQAKSERAFRSAKLRGRWTALTEVCAGLIIERMEGHARKEAWRHWFEVIKDTAGIRPKPIWFRFSTTICRMLPIRVVAWLLCYLPHWLKKKGIHR